MAGFNEGFTPILAIFYADFHPISGPQINCQVPRGAIGTGEMQPSEGALFNFNDIRDYMIPDEQLCNRIISLKVGKYLAVGFPVSIPDSYYQRNYFMFNFVLVFDHRGESIVYETAIRRLGKMFMALEEQSRYLSRLKSYETVESILQQVYQDINNYSECKIPIDESNTINMKLFPIFPPPPDIKPYDVPISTVNLTPMIDANWDPTMEKLIPYINGVNSIRQISELADSKYSLVKKCIQHLMHYGCIIILDIFQFSNIYAPTPKLVYLLTNPEMMKECQSYIYTPYASFHMRLASNGSTSGTGPPFSTSFTSSPGSTTTSLSSASHLVNIAHIASSIDIYTLYSSLKHDETVRDWYEKNKKQLQYIDIRRFLTFGVIKEIIYRVQEYPIITELKTVPPNISVHLYGKEKASGADSVGLTNEIMDQQQQQHSSPQHHMSREIPGGAGTSHRGGSYYSSGTYISNASSSRNSMSTIHANSLPPGHNSLPRASHSSLDSNTSTGYGGSKNSGQRADRNKIEITVSELIGEIIKEPRHFDAICTDLKMPRKDVEKILRENTEWVTVPAQNKKTKLVLGKK